MLGMHRDCNKGLVRSSWERHALVPISRSSRFVLGAVLWERKLRRIAKMHWQCSHWAGFGPEQSITSWSRDREVGMTHMTAERYLMCDSGTAFIQAGPSSQVAVGRQGKPCCSANVTFQHRFLAS